MFDLSMLVFFKYQAVAEDYMYGTISFIPQLLKYLDIYFYKYTAPFEKIVGGSNMVVVGSL